MSGNFSLEEARTIFQIAISKLDVFPSIAQVEEIAEENAVGKRGDLKNRPTKIELIECIMCDGYGLINVVHTISGRTGYCSCGDCENGKKQEFWNQYAINQRKGEVADEYKFGPCPKFSLVMSWGDVDRVPNSRENRSVRAKPIQQDRRLPREDEVDF